MPGLDPGALFDLDRALAPLRGEGVLVFGSGFLTLDMGYAFRPGIPSWARELGSWAAAALSRHGLRCAPRFPRAGPGRGVHPPLGPVRLT